MIESTTLTGPPRNVSIASAEAGRENYDSPPSLPRACFAGASAPQVLFSFAAMLGTCLVAREFFWLRAFIVDPDIWWHIKNGRQLFWPRTIGRRSIPTRSPSRAITGCPTNGWATFYWRRSTGPADYAV